MSTGMTEAVQDHLSQEKNIIKHKEWESIAIYRIKWLWASSILDYISKKKKSAV